MWFGEPHPFPERGSPTRLSALGQQSYEGWSCRHSYYKTLTGMWTTCLLQGIKDVSLMNVISVIENDLMYRMIHDVPAKFMDLLIKWYQITIV